MVVEYKVEGDSFRPEKPRAWSSGVVPMRYGGRTYSLYPDGERVAVESESGDETEGGRDGVVWIQNFFDELRRIVPVSR
jgi:hypothetical protein